MANTSQVGQVGHFRFADGTKQHVLIVADADGRHNVATAWECLTIEGRTIYISTYEFVIFCDPPLLHGASNYQF